MHVTKERMEELLKEHCGDVPSCPESLAQCDWYILGAIDVIDEICKDLKIYEEDI